MITGEEISEGKAQLEKLQAKVDAAIAFYKSLTSLNLPDAIIEIGDGIDTATEALIPKLKEEEFKTWRKRAIKIEKVNEALADLEFGMVEEMTESATSNIARSVYGIVQKFEWLIGHIGQITLMLAEVLGYATGRYGDEIKQSMANVLWSLFTFNYKNLIKNFVGLTKAQWALTKYIAEGSAFGLLAAIMAPALEALSAAKYAATLAPVLALKRATEEAIKQGAFPQGSKRVRRTKPHRVRIKG